MSIVLVGLAVAMALLGLSLVKPRLLMHGAGIAFGFVVILVLPPLVVALGTGEHIERSKTVAYCTSCHVMEQYGRSLQIDDPRYLPAAHYQNGRVPRETACFACHTTYAMYGDLKAKLGGLRHVFINYLGTIPKDIKLYTPYNNRECLHCHEGTRNFEDGSDHKDKRAEIVTNKLSCLSQECHPQTHAVKELDKLKLWSGPEASR